MKSLQYSALCLVFVLCAVPANAALLNPGDSTLPSILSAPTGAVLLASTVEPINFVTDIGTITAAVYSNPDNVFCAGCLDFYYQVELNGILDPMIGFEATSFAGFQTYAGYLANGGSLPGGLFEDGLIPPSVVDRSSGAGETVGFRFAVPVLLGNPSRVLVIQTNATQYGPGTALVIDDPEIDANVVFGPTGPPAAVPEPGSLVLLGFGSAALLVVRGSRARRP